MTLRSVLVCLLLVSVAPDLSAGTGDTDFGPPQPITTSAAGAEALAVADVDGDGDLDVLVASSDDDTVAWHENVDGEGGSWAAHAVSSAVNGASAVLPVDLDDDGDTDVVSAAAVGGVVAWYENDGAGGSFSAHVVSDSVTGARSVAAADIDGDGDLDLASASFDGDTIAWHENQDGLGTTWLKRVVSSGADGATAVVAGDFDADGDADLASASANDDSLMWYESFDGTGTAWIERTITTAADGAAALALADVDGDGRSDLLAASELDDTVAWYRNAGGAALFRGETPISGAVDGARGVAAADLDGDGDVDALSAASASDTVAWHENLDGLGATWAAETISSAADGVRGVAAADVDGDDDADALSAAFESDTVAWYAGATDDDPPPPPEEGGPGLDLKPGACPNNFNAKSNGVLSALVIGSDDLDAELIDLDSLRLGREDEHGGTVAPLQGPPGPKPQLVDLATSEEDAEICECTPGGPDGVTDLLLKFDSEDVARVLELLGVPKGTTVRLALRGRLLDDTPFVVEDCLTIVNS